MDQAAIYIRRKPAHQVVFPQSKMAMPQQIENHQQRGRHCDGHMLPGWISGRDIQKLFEKKETG